MQRPFWEHFHHQADIGIRGVGETLPEAFSQAAIALTAVITDPELVFSREDVQISCSSAENDFLFFDFINELIYQTATKRMLFCEFELEIQEFSLTGIARGEAIDQKRHQPAVEIKAASMNGLEVRQQEQGWWVAQCVVDV